MTTTTPVATRAVPDDHTRDHDDAHEDGLLMHELTVVNTMIARYIVRFLDADAGRATPVSITDEHTFADRLTHAAEAIRARAIRRAQSEQR